MDKFKKVIFFPFKMIGIALIYFYKFCISPFLPHTCRFRPTCSTYALQAIKRFGFFKGFYLAARRVIRCNPKHEGGIDLVPPNIKGEERWLL